MSGHGTPGSRWPVQAGWLFGLGTLVAFGAVTWGVVIGVSQCSDECHRFAVYWLASVFAALAGAVVLVATLTLRFAGRVYIAIRVVAWVVLTVSLFVIGLVLLQVIGALFVRGNPALAGLNLLLFGVPACVGVLAFLLVRRLVAGQSRTPT